MRLSRCRSCRYTCTHTYSHTQIHTHTQLLLSVCCWFFLCLLLTFKHLFLPTVDCGFYKNCRVSFCLVSLALAKCCTHSLSLSFPSPSPSLPPLSSASPGARFKCKSFSYKFFPSNFSPRTFLQPAQLQWLFFFPVFI